MGTTWCRIARAEPVALTAGDEVSALDELFFSLDGSTVAANEDEWRVEVCGIHFIAAERWVQLNLCGEVTYNFRLLTSNVPYAASIAMPSNAFLPRTFRRIKRLSRTFHQLTHRRLR